MQQQPPAGYQAYPAPTPQAEQPQPEQQPESEEYTCPECGAKLENMDHRRKHAIGHYGDKPIAVWPSTRVARERQAALLGKKLAED